MLSMQSSLPAWLPQELSDLCGLSPWDLAYIWVPLATASWLSSFPAWSSQEPMIWVDPSLMVPFELLLGTAHAAQPPRLTISRTILSGLDPDSPPCLACKIPFEFPMRFICRTVSAKIWILCIVNLCLINDCIFCFIHDFLITVWLLSLLVSYPEMYSRYFDP